MLTTDYSHNKVYQISLDNKNVTALDLPDLNSATGIAYNSKTSMVVWSERNTRKIRQSLLTGENASLIYNFGYAYTDSLAIDHSTNNIYFSKVSLISLSGSINVIRDATSPKTIIKGLDNPTAIALHPSKGIITKVNKNTHKQEKWMAHNAEFGMLDSIDVYIGMTHPGIQCSSSISNGTISFCNRYVGDVCSYNCNNGYRKNTSITSLTCLITGQWDIQDNTICEEIKCPTSILNGSLLNCQGQIGSSCNFVCDYGFQKKYGVSSMFCLATGYWTKRIDDVCVKITCPTSISNGSLQNCQAHIGSSCNFVCDYGFQKKNDISSIFCLATGVWTEIIDDVCVPTKCDTTLPNGEFTSDCTGKINASCQYQCKTGSRRQTNISSIFCQHNGHWNHIVDKLCVKNRKKRV
ncbi:hypothetical protein KUTeg_024271 [Tegillarca granosa]|uniref:Sushi domain-containing protein n=1 Tax=Tegillarca granosa TaxID=220873 RepID=A0ABQ9DXX0_TEGGR|nr:hypothetical protein KUTeg_024271 [Tegillarca granosa]